MERGRETKILHLGTPHNHEVFVTIWGLTYMCNARTIKLKVWCLCAFISVVMAVLSLFRHHHGLYALRKADFELITH